MRARQAARDGDAYMVNRASLQLPAPLSIG